MGKFITIILAGGKGERLYPLTKINPKPSVYFGGIYRIIDITLSNCINSGIRSIFVLTQYRSLSLDIHIKKGWSVFSREMGEFIDTIPPQHKGFERWYQGTADAIYQNLYLLEKEKPENVLILSGDHIYKMNYLKMLSFHIEKNADLTISCIEMEPELSKQFGIIKIDNENRITGFQEKPDVKDAFLYNGEKILVSMGVYIFKTEPLIRGLIKDSKMETEHDFGKNVIPQMISSNYRIYGYFFEDENKKDKPYWRDIGTIDSYWQANMDLVDVNPVFNLYDINWPIRTFQEPYPPSKTVFNDEDRRGAAYDSLVSNGCIISGGKVIRSVLSYNVRVNSYAEVHESIIMPGVSIGRNCRIRKTIIDENVSIPEGYTIGYDPEEDKKRFVVSPGGITVVPEGYFGN
ncbi:glucose-1-phosphate adenylyltransferase [candidate division KSB1 bacterium]|nr:MAG: glucose-1-phosphate adenylyltransferase [candidate division KSB1 bacterium]